MNIYIYIYIYIYRERGRYTLIYRSHEHGRATAAGPLRELVAELDPGLGRGLAYTYVYKGWNNRFRNIGSRALSPKISCGEGFEALGGN